jgi:TonB-dependent receptor
MPLRTSPTFAGSVKFGAKYRNKAKDRDNSTTVFSTDEDIFMSGLLDPTFDPKNFYEGRYEFGPFFGIDPARDLNDRPDFEAETDPEADLADYDASENVVAAYAMADLALSPRLTLLPGVRLESTGFEYTGNEVLFDDEGDFAGLRAATDSGRYTQVLPGVHLRYALTPESNLRVAFTRSLARPNYYDLVPYQLVLEEDLEIERGNPELQPSTSWNLDFMAERYLPSVGVISGGVFYKSIADFIFPFRYEEDRNGDSYDVTQPQNGPGASVFGLELAVQNHLRFLPAPFDGLGIYANYTFTDSSAELPERDEPSLPLPGQAQHSGNLAVWYEKDGFSARMAFTFRDGFLSEVGGDADEDLFVDAHYQMDLSISHAVTPRVRLFADLLNLTDRPLRVYEGTSDRPIQEEYYRWWTTFGVKFGF